MQGIVEERTEEGQVFRLEGGNKWVKCYSSGEVGHMSWTCPRSAGSKNGKNGLGKRVVKCREGGGSVLDVEKMAIIIM